VPAGGARRRHLKGRRAPLSLCRHVIEA